MARTAASREKSLRDFARARRPAGMTDAEHRQEVAGLERSLTCGAIEDVLDAAVAGDVTEVIAQAEWLTMMRLQSVAAERTYYPWEDLIHECERLVASIDTARRLGAMDGQRTPDGQMGLMSRSPDDAHRSWVRMTTVSDPTPDDARKAVEHSVRRLTEIVVSDGARLLRRLIREWGKWVDRWPRMTPQVYAAVLDQSVADSMAAATKFVREDLCAAAERERERTYKPPAAGDGWGIKFMTMFSMSEDSHKFVTRSQLERAGYTLVEGNVFRAPADVDAAERLAAVQAQDYQALVAEEQRAGRKRRSKEFPGETDPITGGRV